VFPFAQEKAKLSSMLYPRRWRACGGSLGCGAITDGCSPCLVSEHHLGLGVKGCGLPHGVACWQYLEKEEGGSILITAVMYPLFVREAERHDPPMLLKLHHFMLLLK